MSRRFVILDRDGTINVEREYLSHPDEVELLPRALAGMRQMAANGLGLVVVTNQSGIARGYFDQSCLTSIHGRLVELLAAGGVDIDGIYYCPHHPEDACKCRKPEPGLVQQAARRWGFNPSDAFIIGDMECDITLGRRIGATSILVQTGHGAKTADHVSADAVVADLEEAASFITGRV